MNVQPPLMFSSWRSCLWSEWNTPALPKMGHPICSWGFSFFPFFFEKKKQTSAPIRGISSHYFQVSQPRVLITSSIYHDKLTDKRLWYMLFWWNKIKYVFHPYNVATTDEFKLRKLCETNSVAKIADIASFWPKHLHCFETHLVCIYLMQRNNSQMSDFYLDGYALYRTLFLFMSFKVFSWAQKPASNILVVG